MEGNPISQRIKSGLFFNLKSILMAYKVKYTTLAVLKDGTNGNIPQTSETIYTDWDIPDIKAKIDLYYQILDKKLVSVIDSIERVDGFCLPVNL